MGNKNSAINTKLQAKEWQWQLKTEVKTLDREIKKIQVDEAKLQREIHDQAEKGNVDAVQMLARSVVRSRKAVQRLEKTKASMHAVNLQLTTSIATMSTTSSIRLSADIMRKMNGIARIPEVSGTMEAMRREMARCAEAEDAIEDALRDESEEVEASSEVQKLLEEMALDQMGPLARAKPRAPVQEPQRCLQEPQGPTRSLFRVLRGSTRRNDETIEQPDRAGMRFVCHRFVCRFGRSCTAKLAKPLERAEPLPAASGGEGSATKPKPRSASKGGLEKEHLQLLLQQPNDSLVERLKVVKSAWLHGRGELPQAWFASGGTKDALIASLLAGLSEFQPQGIELPTGLKAAVLAKDFCTDSCMQRFGLDWAGTLLQIRRAAQSTGVVEPGHVSDVTACTGEDNSRVSLSGSKKPAVAEQPWLMTQSADLLLQRLKTVKAAWLDNGGLLQSWLLNQEGKKEEMLQRLHTGLAEFQKQGISMPHGLKKAVLAEDFTFEACMKRFSLDWGRTKLQIRTADKTTGIVKPCHVSDSPACTGEDNSESTLCKPPRVSLSDSKKPAVAEQPWLLTQSAGLLIQRLNTVKAAWLDNGGLLMSWFNTECKREEVLQRLHTGLAEFQKQGISMPPGLKKAVLAEDFTFEACMKRFSLDWGRTKLQIQTADKTTGIVKPGHVSDSPACTGEDNSESTLCKPPRVSLSDSKKPAVAEQPWLMTQSADVLIQRLKTVKAAWLDNGGLLMSWLDQQGKKEDILQRLHTGLAEFQKQGISMPTGLKKAVLAEDFAFEACMEWFSLDW
ncbi:unnamed protein product, partial [Polarella glacialis]